MNREELEVIGKLEHTLDYGKEVVITDRESHVLLHYIEKMNQSNKTLQSKLYRKNDKHNKIIDYIDSPKFSKQFENVGNEENVRKYILEILDEENK